MTQIRCKQAGWRMAVLLGLCAATPALAVIDRGRVAVVVDSGIFSAVQASINTYTADLAQTGFDSVVINYSGTAEDLRALLASYYADPNSLVGAVLVGQIPYVICESKGGFGTLTYPTDIFYCDLNGIWSDILDDPPIAPGNGKYDTWSGDQDLEIWVSRIKTDNIPLLGDEVSLIDAYFARNHALRWDILNPHHSSLVYLDDDFSGIESEHTANHSLLFGKSNVTTVLDNYVTTKADYINNRLTGDFHLIHVASHGNWAAHGFNLPGLGMQLVSGDDYVVADPCSRFFIFNSCSLFDFSKPANFCGGIITFNPESSTLLGWGWTKISGFIPNQVTYEYLKTGACIGESFRQSFNQAFAGSSRINITGVVLLGDGSLGRYDDCNGNGMNDVDDLVLGASADCNGNRIPDECDGEFDCNGNGQTDICDIASGVSMDCQLNGIPDECDIASGSSLDLDGDGVPDECQLLVPSEYATIQAAIDAAGIGMTVQVAPGTYAGAGNKNLDYQGKSITVECDGVPGACILDCEGDGFGVIFDDGEDAKALFDGFTIQKAPSLNGHGALTIKSDSSPTIRNCFITDNSGYGIYCHGYETRPAVENCYILENKDSGLYASLAGPVVRDCIFAANGAPSTGGGVYLKSSDDAIFESCTIAGNYAGHLGGGIYAYYSDYSLSHSIVWGNSAVTLGDGLYLQNSNPTVTYSNIQGGYSGLGNIQSDPNFVSQPFYDNNGTRYDASDDTWAIGDSRLQAASPCIDAGDPNAVITDSNISFVDADGHYRIVDGDRDGVGRIDMGAYEYSSSLPGDLDCSGCVDDNDPFTLAMAQPTNYAAQYPDCHRILGDVNGSGEFDMSDVSPFIHLLEESTCP